MSAARNARRLKQKANKLQTGLTRLSKGPCMLCNEPSKYALIWLPDVRCSQRLGLASDHSRA